MSNKWSFSPKDIRVPIVISVVVCLSLIACIVTYNMMFPVSICGQRLKRNVSEIDLSGRDISGQADRILRFTHLRYADLTDTGLTCWEYDLIHAAMPECTVRWSVPLGGKYFPSDTPELRLDDSVSPSELCRIGYFDRLQLLDARDYPLCDELYDAAQMLRQSDTNAANCLFSGTLYGAEINSDTLSLDLSDQKIDDLSEFYSKLRFFPHMKKIDVGDIACPDEEMDRLNRSFPDTKIVWLVEFGRWQVRTDIKVFSTLVGNEQTMVYGQEDFLPLLTYCTDLEALDLGHNRLRDGSCLAGLSHLAILILSYNYDIKDLGFLYSLPGLIFLELRSNSGITDLEPIGSLSDLQILEIQRLSTVKNASALARCSKLELIMANDVYFIDTRPYLIQKALPDCVFDTYSDDTARQGDSIRKIAQIKTLFANWPRVDTESYKSWNDVKFTDRPTCGWYIH